MSSGVPAAVEFRALGTTARLVVTSEASLPTAHAVLSDVLDDVDRACSRFRDDSELSRVNRSPDNPCPIGAVLLGALEVALRAARLTDGDVDPTVGATMRVLGYDRDFAAVARSGAPVAHLVAVVPGWRTVQVDREASTVRVPPGVELDLGATAKAYAADRAARRVHQCVGGGVLVALGGDVAVAGAAPPNGWSVRVTDDHAAGLSASGETIAIRAGGVATSSTTVRRWSRGEDELHHIIDPRNGRPAESCWRTVSVAARTCVDANIASTAAIVRGARAPAWLNSLGLPARLVSGAGEITRVGSWPEGSAA